MDFIDPELSLEKLSHYFLPYKSSQVIFDPAFGFSKTYDQNWMILDEFSKLQELTGHSPWLIGLSRKSFLRKKIGLTEINPETIEFLDCYHEKIFNKMGQTLKGEVWVRTHRPELIKTH